MLVRETYKSMQIIAPNFTALNMLDLPSFPDAAFCAEPIVQGTTSAPTPPTYSKGAQRELILHPEEKSIGASMAEKRRSEFFTGRHCFHTARRTLNLEFVPLLRQGKVPSWPADSVASISHNQQLACAIVATNLKGVGVDVEHTQRVEKKLWRKLFTEDELKYLRNTHLPMAEDLCATVMFSAKEAGYKAVFPINKQFISFQEVTVQITDDGEFVFNYVGPNHVNKILEQGSGIWRVIDSQILTLFHIPMLAV